MKFDQSKPMCDPDSLAAAEATFHVATDDFFCFSPLLRRSRVPRATAVLDRAPPHNVEIVGSTKNI